METKIIDGKSIAQEILNDLKAKIAGMAKSPKLAIILVGKDPASLIYVGNKIKKAQEIGAQTNLLNFEETVSENKLLETIKQLNKDPQTSGIILQLPIPKHINLAKLTKAIDPNKDIDGFHPLNVGLLQTEKASSKQMFIACTALACLKAITSVVENLAGKHVVIVNRSNLIGKPLSLLLLEQNATVTICHSFSSKLAEITKLGDIVVCAIGKAKFFDKSYFKQGAVIIDVGISRKEGDEKISGDVDFDDVAGHASYITPVPGGIGPLTVAYLLSNLVLSESSKN